MRITVAELTQLVLDILLGEEDKDYWVFERDEEEYVLWQWIHRN